MSTQIIEHVVLFKHKEGTDPADSTAMTNRINSLVSLQEVLHLTSGPILRIQSSSLTFTHVLHARYNSKHDLDAYTTHPAHVAVVNANAPLVGDAMALDWVVDDLRSDLVVPPCSVVRLTFLKLKENLGDEVKSEILGVVRAIGGNFREIGQYTLGENFSPQRAKGFSIGSLAVFPGIEELEGVDSNAEFVKYHKDKIGEYLEDMVVIDYVVPSLH